MKNAFEVLKYIDNIHALIGLIVIVVVFAFFKIKAKNNKKSNNGNIINITGLNKTGNVSQSITNKTGEEQDQSFLLHKGTGYRPIFVE